MRCAKYYDFYLNVWTHTFAYQCPIDKSNVWAYTFAYRCSIY
jgi:hypothetical protein